MCINVKVAVGTDRFTKWVVEKHRGRILSLVYRVIHKITIGANTDWVDISTNSITFKISRIFFGKFEGFSDLLG